MPTASQVQNPEIISVVGGLLPVVSNEKNGLATTDMFIKSPFQTYSSIRCYRLGKAPRCLIFGGRDSNLGAYFVQTSNNILRLSDNHTISFYKDSNELVYADTGGGFNIAAITFNPASGEITPVQDFNPEEFTLISVK